ncbi:MAG: DNA repair protein [Mogibacterium sp.]|nr:DNA repair protein [Mogibacterium sp.]
MAIGRHGGSHPVSDGPDKTAGKTHADPAENRDLSRLKKKELLEIMLAQSKELDALRVRVAELEKELAEHDVRFSKIGSLAEASLAVTKIFEEADKAAAVYLENIRRLHE